MSFNRSRFIPLLAVGALAAAAGTTTNAGAAAGPVPGCAGITVKDPAGDQTANQQEAPKNTDIRELFFRNDGGVTTANIRLTEVSKTVPSPYTSVIVYVLWNVTSATDPAVTDGFASARINSDGTTAFGYGTLATGGGFTTAGETTGALAEGADGVISIVIPKEAVPADKKLPGPMVDARLGVTAPAPVSRGVVSRADDTTEGKTYTVGGCTDGAAATPTTPPPTTGGGGGGTTPPPQTEQPAPTGGGTAEPQKAPVTIDVTKVKSARKSLSIGLRSSEPLTSLSGTLRKGTKKIGTGKLGKLGSTGTIKIKVKKKVKKGKYTFALTAKDSSGQPVKANLSIKVK